MRIQHKRIFIRLLNKIISCLLVMALVMASAGVPVNASERADITTDSTIESEGENQENQETVTNTEEEQSTSDEVVREIGEIEILPEEEIQTPISEPEDVQSEEESVEEDIIEESSEVEIIEEEPDIVQEMEVIIEENSEENPDEALVTDDDPMELRYRKKAVDQASLIPISSVMADEWPNSNDFSDKIIEYNHGIYSENKNISKGIDVSKYQKDIDWEKVKEDGVEFAFIRVGFRGYGSTGSLNDDIKYKDNIEGALKAGIPVGVYMFSQAISVYEAVEEADYILERIEDYNITLPVIMDYEFAGDYGRLENAHLSKEEATEVCNAFCERVSEEGYEAMLYADYGMLRDHLYPSRIEDKYKIWIARWNDATEYEGEYASWQFSDIGRVEGICDSSGYIATDLNFGYGLLDIPVTLNSKGGMFGDSEEITITLEQGTTLLEADYKLPKKEGRTFRGWSEDRSSQKATYNFSEPIIATKLELYAVWRKKKDKKVTVLETGPDTAAITEDDKTGGTESDRKPTKKKRLIINLSPKRAALPGHVFVKYLDADSFNSENIAQYKLTPGGVKPEIELYYEPYGCDPSATEPSENAVLLVPGKDYGIRYINYKDVAEYNKTGIFGINRAPVINIIGGNDYIGNLYFRYTIY